MKGIITLAAIAIFTLGLFTVSGCARRGSDIDTSKVESAFKAAPPVEKADVQAAVTSIKAGNYAEAMVPLQKVAKSANLTPDQKTALQDLMKQVQEKVTGMGQKALGDAKDTASQAGQNASKAVEGALPK